jgi:hypothetical protein
MQQIKQMCKYLMHYGDCLIKYLFGVAGVTVLFSLLYYYVGVEHPFLMSLRIIEDMDIENYGNNIAYLLHASKFVKTIIDLFLVAGLTSRFLAPVCPICFSEYVIYNSKLRKIVFRYWIMKRQHRFLYNATIRICLTTEDEHKRGVNNITTYWEWTGSKGQLGKIRGIRFVELSKEDTAELIEKITEKHNENNEKGLCLDVMITGSDENGRIFNKWKSYKVDEILANYDFAPVINDDAYCSQKFKEEIAGTHADKVLRKQRHEKFYNFQNFDKVYALSTADSDIKQILKGEPDRNDLLTPEEVIEGKYKFINWVTRKFFYYSSRK